MQRLLSAVDKGNMGTLNLSDIAITFVELIQVAEDTPLLSQSTRYLNLSTWINPAGGQINVSGLVALRSCFTGLLSLDSGTRRSDTMSLPGSTLLQLYTNLSGR